MSSGEQWTGISCRLDEDALEVTVAGRAGDSDVILARRLDHSLGWGDIVDELAEFLAGVFEGLHGLDLRASPGGWARLWDAAEHAVDALEGDDTALVQEQGLAERDGALLDLELELSEDKLTRVVQPALQKVLTAIEGALEEAGKKGEDLSSAKLSGRGGRGGLLARTFEQHFGIPPEIEGADHVPAPSREPVAKSAPGKTTEEKDAEPDEADAPATDHSPLPPDLRNRAEQLHRRARDLTPLLHPDDEADVSASLEDLTEALAGTDPDCLSEAVARLDDLLFFIAGEPL